MKLQAEPDTPPVPMRNRGLAIAPCEKGMNNKIYSDAAAALGGLLFNGMAIAAGGFGLCGVLELLINAIREEGTKKPDDRLQQCRRLRTWPVAGIPPVRKMISPYVAENAEFMPAGGAGIASFCMRIGVLPDGKDHRDFNRQSYILESGIVTDVAIVKA